MRLRTDGEYEPVSPAGAEPAVEAQQFLARHLPPHASESGDPLTQGSAGQGARTGDWRLGDAT